MSPRLSPARLALPFLAVALAASQVLGAVTGAQPSSISKSKQKDFSIVLTGKALTGITEICVGSMTVMECAPVKAGHTATMVESGQIQVGHIQAASITNNKLKVITKAGATATDTGKTILVTH